MINSSTKGGCYCGNIRYQFQTPPRLSVNCRCDNRRRAVGAHSVVWVIINNDPTSRKKRSPVRYKTDTKARRTFCPDCGSSPACEAPDHPEHYPPTKDAYITCRIPWAPKIINTES